MKQCTGCKHANWDHTTAGRLHPSGNGRCTKVVELPQLPAAFYWLGRPVMGDGHINRREELKDHCAYWSK